jgi:adenosylmethionine-8-amino-7-oxononanoate aminotransferase
MIPLNDANTALAQRDLQHIWHPCTQMHDHEHEHVPMVPIVRGEGPWLIDAEGRRYLDGISSWWTNLFGHANPRIAAGLAEQAKTLEHVIFAGFTHPPAIELAEQLVRITPAGLEKVFFADNGSAAIEVALKMSFHYWLNQGHGEKTRFIALTGSYHGETLGALSVSDVALYRKTYAPLLLTPILAPSPDAYEGEPGESAEQTATRRLEAMRALLEQPVRSSSNHWCNARVACACITRAISLGCVRFATVTTCTSSPMKSPSALAAPARCSPANKPASPPTSCVCPKGLPAAPCHYRRC